MAISLEHGEALRTDETEWGDLKLRPSGNARIVCDKQPAQIHRLSARVEQFKEFLIITKDPDKVRDQFYRCLDAETEVPLDPSWADWLWKLFEEKEWSTRLKTLAGKNQGYLVNFQPGELIYEISQAIELRAPEIVACMRPSLKTKTTGGSNGDLKPENVS